MAASFESGALLGHVYTLADGSSVRLRLARTSDFAAIRARLADAGFDAPDLEAARLVNFDPRRRYVVCATGLVGSTESLLGVGSIRLAQPAPDLLVVPEASGGDVRRLLEGVLISASRAGRRAA